MASYPDQSDDPVVQLAAIISRLQDDVAALQSRSVRIPTLDADPPAGDPTNIWRFDDGRLRLRGDDGQVHEFLPTGTPGGSTTTKPKPANTSPKRHRKVYAATWGRVFCDRHGVETGARLRYGYYDDTHGERRIMLGFDDVLIRSHLAGAKVRKVELHMLNTDSWAHAGIDVTFGAHNKSAAPGSYSAVRRGVFTGRWPESGTGAAWRTVPVWYGQAFRDGTVRGLTIDQPASSQAYYGEMSWSSVQLAITYTK